MDDSNYADILKDAEIIVIDGCMNRCATKLLEQRHLRIGKKIFIPDMVKKFKLSGSAFYDEPQWSPDSQKIALISAKGELQTVSADGSNLQRFDLPDSIDKFATAHALEQIAGSTGF
jgi:hypothetical protein